MKYVPYVIIFVMYVGRLDDVIVRLNDEEDVIIYYLLLHIYIYHFLFPL